MRGNITVFHLTYFSCRLSTKISGLGLQCVPERNLNHRNLEDIRGEMIYFWSHFRTERLHFHREGPVIRNQMCIWYHNIFFSKLPESMVRSAQLHMNLACSRHTINA